MPTKRSAKTRPPASSAGAAPAVKRTRARKAAAPAAGAVAAPGTPANLSVEFTDSEREAIERLAYSYWLERGCQGGSSQEDWLRAEEEIRRRSARAGEAGGSQ